MVSGVEHEKSFITSGPGQKPFDIQSSIRLIADLDSDENTYQNID